MLIKKFKIDESRYHSVIHEPLRPVQIIRSGSNPESSSVNEGQNRKSFYSVHRMSVLTGNGDVDVEEKTVLLSDHSFDSDILELKKNIFWINSLYFILNLNYLHSRFELLTEYFILSIFLTSIKGENPWSARLDYNFLKFSSSF